MNDCIFCKILKGEIPSCRVYEDEWAVAFMDIFPFAKGHVLVIPRVHVATLPDLPQDVLARLMVAVQNVSRLVLRGLPCDGFNLAQSNGACSGQTVHHVHFHIVPRHEGVEVEWFAHKNLYARGEMEEVAARIRESSGSILLPRGDAG